MTSPGEFPGEGKKISPLAAGIRIPSITEKTDVHKNYQKTVKMARCK
jgi:hypothetical protein